MHEQGIYWIGGAHEATGSDGTLKLAGKGVGERISLFNSCCVYYLMSDGLIYPEPFCRNLKLISSEVTSFICNFDIS